MNVLPPFNLRVLCVVSVGQTGAFTLKREASLERFNRVSSTENFIISKPFIFAYVNMYKAFYKRNQSINIYMCIYIHTHIYTCIYICLCIKVYFGMYVPREIYCLSTVNC